MTKPKIFLDANIVQNSILYKDIKCVKTINVPFGPHISTKHMKMIEKKDRSLKFHKDNNYRDYINAHLIKDIAILAFHEEIEFVQTFEVDSESWGENPKATKMYGAPITKIPSPTENNFIGINHIYDFLTRISHPRFNEIKNLVPAKKDTIKHLKDAYHLWSAEYNKCTYFLTMDNKLRNTIDTIATQKCCYPLNTQIVSPIDLLAIYLPIFDLHTIDTIHDRMPKSILTEF